jgi:hypothetical protein
MTDHPITFTITVTPSPEGAVVEIHHAGEPSAHPIPCGEAKTRKSKKPQAFRIHQLFRISDEDLSALDPQCLDIRETELRGHLVSELILAASAGLPAPEERPGGRAGSPRSYKLTVEAAHMLDALVAETGLDRSKIVRRLIQAAVSKSSSTSQNKI